jgi:type IV pilus assembly protein PilE
MPTLHTPTFAIMSTLSTARRMSIMAASCATPAALPQPRKVFRARRAAAGFTLVEMMIAVSVAGVLSSVAYPSFVDQVQRVRRTDAVVAVMQVQWAQERWRANNTAYGSLAEVGVGAASAAGYYKLQVSAATASGYEVVATATGAQARDTTCAVLKLNMQGANPTYSSGADASTANAADINRKCWSL